ncbi:centrosomal protein of 126 kDa isoform X1 [Nothobranchius furzeri]|uniref:KIAA1377 n=2 Tax=Nothobranchius furzeri TaxID=105023 RepID=A0A1A7ZIL1_NOTFU
MQAYRENFSYLSKYRLGNERNLENERQLLVQEQKLCKVRARRFSLETKRRRKALDERRNQVKVEEQRVREKILKQRKQQVQDATERFQRAHLPPSQRYRKPLRRNLPNIEDALSQIQGTFGSHTQQSSLLSNTTNISRTCTPSPKPPIVSKSSHRQALSTVEAYAELLQEVSSIETLQHDSLQGSHGSDCCHSDSLSSKDSLENEDVDQGPSDPQCSDFSLPLDFRKTNSEQNDLCPTSASFSAMMLLDENSAQLPKLHEPTQEKQAASDWTSEDTSIPKASWEFTSNEEQTTTENKPTPHNSDLLTHCKLPNEDPKHFELKYSEKTHNNRDDPSDTVQSSFPKQKAVFILKEQDVYDDNRLKHQSATNMSETSKNGKDILFWTPQTKSTADNFIGAFMQTEKEAYYLSSQKEPCANMNNLNKVLNSELKAEKAINTASLQNASLSNIHSETRECSECPQEENGRKPSPEVSSHPVSKVRFIKGILKKQTKYMSPYGSCRYGPENFTFAKRVALAIRDSVEITRARAKEVEINNGIKKKLRWFDEVHTRKDHQPRLTTESASDKSEPSLTPAASAGYHFTKEAWADVGVQVNLPLEQDHEVKVAHSSTKTNGPKVPQRDRSARVGQGPVPSWTRKGTVIRPQSATEVNQIAKTQGMVMVPRPPPRTESVEEKMHINSTPYGMNCKQARAVEEGLSRNNSVRIFSPPKRVIKTDCAVMYTPQPHLCTCPLSEGDTKSMPMSGHQESHNKTGRENGNALEITPTDDEISQLWHGVRSALHTKDGKKHAQESRQGSRKPGTDQSRQPPGSGSRRLLRMSRPTRQYSGQKAVSSTCSTNLNEGFETTAQFYLAEGLLSENQTVGVTETLRPGTVLQQQGLAPISSEEKKILLSLDKLNHQLYHLQGHV